MSPVTKMLRFFPDPTLRNRLTEKWQGGGKLVDSCFWAARVRKSLILHKVRFLKISASEQEEFSLCLCTRAAVPLPCWRVLQLREAVHVREIA
jgi:hypothetical protein